MPPLPPDGLPRWKRFLDLALATLGLPFLAAATFAVSLLHALVSPGPLFFRQSRIGHLGRTFTLYKFRTMRAGADEAAHRRHLAALAAGGGPLRKLDQERDTRVFPGGRFLRASGIDELPQLVNVLRGERSVVGPRGPGAALSTWSAVPGRRRIGGWITRPPPRNRGDRPWSAAPAPPHGS